MENRRPPTPGSYRAKQHNDKGRDTSSFRYDKYQNPDTGSSGGRFQKRNDRDTTQRRTGGGWQDRDQRDNRDTYGKFQSKGRFEGKGKGHRGWTKENKVKITSDLQVTDGKYRGKLLQSPASPKIRPTARRLREIMFKIIFRRVRAGRFLDLCSGTGTVGIEAISRGAMISTFVERSARFCSLIRKNLEKCGIKPGHGEVVEMEILPFLKKMHKRRRFWDVVYFDPPCDANYEEALNCIGRGTAIKQGGILLIEHPSEMFFPEAIGLLKRWRVIVQNETAMSFYERK